MSWGEGNSIVAPCSIVKYIPSQVIKLGPFQGCGELWWAVVGFGEAMGYFLCMNHIALYLEPTTAHHTRLTSLNPTNAHHTPPVTTP